MHHSFDYKTPKADKNVEYEQKIKEKL